MRNRTIWAFAACLSLFSLPLLAQQSSLPEKPIRLIVGGPPGGAPDTVARLLAQSMSFSQPVVVENKNGAAQMIAADFVARSPADGTVLLLASQTAIAVSPVLQKSELDPIKDFTGVGLIGEAPLVLVAGPSLAAENVPELIAYAKAHPEELNFGHGGVGSTPHMAGELFQQATDTKLTNVPYPGEQASMIDIMAGRIHFMFANASSALPHVRNGKLRAFAITSDVRTPSAPEILTLNEAGVPGFSAATWLGIVAPAATPKAAIDQLNAELNRVLSLPEIQEKLAVHGFSIQAASPEQFNRFMLAEHEKWGKLIQDANIAIN